jgi:hypothetical protein
MTENEIAQGLGVDQSTIIIDIKALTVFNLAKPDLTYNGELKQL